MALNSTSVMKIVDLLCEGSIEGLVAGKSGRQSIYLDETPASEFDHSEIDYDFRRGSRNQSRVPQSARGASNIVDVNTEIGENYSETLNADNLVKSRDYGKGVQTRSITDLDADSFKILFTIPALFSTAKEGLARGQLFNATVNVEVFLKSTDSGYNRVYERSITGISRNNYQFQTPRILLTGVGPWEVRVKKNVKKENDFEISYVDFQEINKKTALGGSRANRLLWTSTIETVEFKNNYPYSVVAGLDISTKAFESLPTRAYLIKGKKLMIPSNATVQEDGRLTFEGAFDGSLEGPIWSTCPVCALYDMLVNDTYGAGDFIASTHLSWVDLYPLAQYANQQVDTPDGKEARFAINTVIGSRTDAYNLIQDLASVFRGMTFWASNTVNATADHGNLDGSDISPVHLYTNSNVIEGQFEYKGTSLKTRNTSIRIRYNDPENFYKSNWIVVEDYNLINKYGYQVKEIVAFGATSKWQAQRMGRWLMAAEELDGETVTFSCGLDAVSVLPGQVFAIADEMRAGVRLSGRIVTTGTLTLVLDQEITLPSGDDHELTCALPDGTIETKRIDTVSGSTVTLESHQPFSNAPLTNAVWSLSSSAVTEQKFRCIQVGDNDDGTFSITGVIFNDSIYETADTAKDLKFEDVTTFDSKPATPINLIANASLVQINDNTVNRMTVEWSRGLNGNSIYFELRYKTKANGNWKKTVTPINAEIWEIDGLKAKTKLTVEVRARGPAPLNKISKWASLTTEVPEPAVQVTPTSALPAAPTPAVAVVDPPNPANVTLQVITDTEEVLLRWDVEEVGGINPGNLKAIIKHATETDGTGTWPNSTKLTTVAATTEYAVLPLMEGEYLIKFEDTTSGLKSVDAFSATLDLPDPVAKHVIQTRREDTTSPPFDGDYEGLYYSTQSGQVGLVLSGNDLIDDIGAPGSTIPTIDDITLIDFTGDRLSSGEYILRNLIDLGGVYTIDIKRHLKSAGVYPSDLWDTRTELIDRWSDIDGLNADAVSSQMFFRTANATITDDDLLLETGDKLLFENSDEYSYEANILYGPWIPLDNGKYTGRTFQFKVKATSDHVDQTPVISELGYTMTINSRTEQSTATIASGAGAKAVTFANGFYQTPNVSVSANNLVSGDYFQLSSISTTGFTVHFKNSSNASIDREFNYQAVGFGKKEP